MAKTKSAGGSASEAAKKGGAKKAAAPAKGGAKKPPAKAPAKKPPAKAAKPPARKPPAKKPSAQATLPIEVVEDAEIISEIAAAAEDAEATEASEATERDVDATVDADLADSDTEEVVEVAEPATLTPEEQELASLYGSDLAQPAIAHAEYADRQTADEDRPMVPEINARDERKQQWQERRDRRRQRRDERNQQRHDRQQQQRHDRPQGQAHPGQGQNQGRPQHASNGHNGHQGQARPAQPAPSVNTTAPVVPAPNAPAAPAGNHEHDALARVGTPLGDAAATVFAQLRNGQPLPVKQLAAMMRKRSLTEVDPEQLWPQLKAELLGDERSYRALGLRPRIVYRGRDLFAPGPVALSQTADAEASVAAALSRLAGATHRALAARIARATSAGFERIIHAYLVAAGYREITWVKRVNNIAYAQAIAPGIDRAVLISARSGDQPIDRRGVGELRVGVEAKDLIAGILFSARELSEDAERELERAGRSIAVMCGDQLVAALIASGVGVVSAAAPVHYVDDQLLDELLAG